MESQEVQEMTTSERLEVESAINTVFHVRFKNHKFNTIYYGDFKYTFYVNDFNDYTFLEKGSIK